ncbi:MAG TPA: APC family permease [Vicinamibacteria bacterium]|nr:APC family permease [Vicinamibacteria bacterium]
MPEPQPRTREGLVRGIGLVGLTASIVNSTVGGGIFILPAVVALRLGGAAPLAYLVCLATMTLVVTCFAIAGSRVSKSGGTYGYVERAFGGYAGFMAGVLLWLSDALGNASVAVALAASLGVLLPALGRGLGRATLLAGLFALLALVNVRGVGPGVRLVKAITAAKLVPLALLVAAGLAFVAPANLAWPGLPRVETLGETVLLLLFAFVGVEVALEPSGEVDDPARTVPLSVFLALGFTTLLYAAVQLVSQGVLGGELARYAEAPLAEAAFRVLGPAGRALLVVGATVSISGYLASSMLGSPRTLFAFGRAGVLPAVFARVHPRFGTPAVAIWVYAATVAVLAVTGSFERLLVMSNVALLFLYLLCALACFQLVRRDVREEGRPFRVPGERVIPFLAGGAVLWVLANATASELGVTAAVAAMASLLYLARRLQRAGRDGR